MRVLDAYVEMGGFLFIMSIIEQILKQPASKTEAHGYCNTTPMGKVESSRKPMTGAYSRARIAFPTVSMQHYP